jgi:hypothetical protein
MGGTFIAKSMAPPTPNHLNFEMEVLARLLMALNPIAVHLTFSVPGEDHQRMPNVLASFLKLRLRPRERWLSNAANAWASIVLACVSLPWRPFADWMGVTSLCHRFKHPY